MININFGFKSYNNFVVQSHFIKDVDVSLEQDFSLGHRVQTGSGNHPVSYPIATGDYYIEEKRLGRENNH
jgi:hypothetical protein